MKDYSKGKITLEIASRAFNGTSFSPQKRGKQYLEAYNKTCDEMHEFMKKWVPEEELETQFNQFVDKFTDLCLTFFSSHSNVMSTMITGPSNFPSRRNQKRSEWADNHRKRMYEFPHKVEKGILKKYGPKKFINSDDPEAILKLTDKLHTLQRRLDQLKELRAFIKTEFKGIGTDNSKYMELVMEAQDKFDAGVFKEAEYNLKHYKSFTLDSYHLAYVRKKIKTVEERIITLERCSQLKAAKDGQEEVFENGCKLVINATENRYQIFLPHKISTQAWKEARKLTGGVWSRKNQCFQRKITSEHILRQLRINIPHIDTTPE